MTVLGALSSAIALLLRVSNCLVICRDFFISRTGRVHKIGSSSLLKKATFTWETFGRSWRAQRTVKILTGLVLHYTFQGRGTVQSLNTQTRAVSQLTMKTRLGQRLTLVAILISILVCISKPSKPIHLPYTFPNMATI